MFSHYCSTLFLTRGTLQCAVIYSSRPAVHEDARVPGASLRLSSVRKVVSGVPSIPDDRFLSASYLGFSVFLRMHLMIFFPSQTLASQLNTGPADSQ
eukprot:6177111-Pleurochrysis_carterae.AAC.6